MPDQAPIRKRLETPKAAPAALLVPEGLRINGLPGPVRQAGPDSPRQVGKEADSKNSGPQMAYKPRRARLEDAHNPISPIRTQGQPTTPLDGLGPRVSGIETS